MSNRKTAHFRFPSVAQKRRLLKRSIVGFIHPTAYAVFRLKVRYFFRRTLFLSKVTFEGH